MLEANFESAYYQCTCCSYVAKYYFIKPKDSPWEVVEGQKCKWCKEPFPKNYEDEGWIEYTDEMEENVTLNK